MATHNPQQFGKIEKLLFGLVSNVCSVCCLGPPWESRRRALANRAEQPQGGGVGGSPWVIERVFESLVVVVCISVVAWFCCLLVLGVLRCWTCSGGSVVVLRHGLLQGLLVGGCRLALCGLHGLHRLVRIGSKYLCHVLGLLNVLFSSLLEVFGFVCCPASGGVGGCRSVRPLLRVLCSLVLDMV